MIIKILKNNNLIIWEEDYHIKRLKDNNLNNYNKENYHQFLKIIIEINIVIWKKKMIMKIDFCFY